jgi:hypothetical protein
VTDLDSGLLLEVWEKGMLWDKAIGYYWCPLTTIPFTQVRKKKHRVRALFKGTVSRDFCFRFFS